MVEAPANLLNSPGHRLAHPADGFHPAKSLFNQELVTVQLRIRRDHVERVKRYAEALERDEDRSFTIAEVFPEYQGKGPASALRAYRIREGLTQKQLAGIPAFS